MHVFATSKTWTTNALKRSAWTISRQLSWGHRIPAWFGPRQDVEVQGNVMDPLELVDELEPTPCASR
ncbi:class I tRNA ligase family protein [Bradyrhizobium sp. IC3195]|nr:class I tRNA ligase family protein [Bradyrhizobium sp. IC3195]